MFSVTLPIDFTGVHANSCKFILKSPVSILNPPPFKEDGPYKISDIVKAESGEKYLILPSNFCPLEVIRNGCMLFLFLALRLL